jgi:hypothetical protein
LEHSTEAALWTTGGFAAGAGVAGAGVCANAEPTRNREAIAVAATREESVIMGSTSG